LHISAARIVSGQNEINRMHAEVKMVVGMLLGMVSDEDAKKFRGHRFGDEVNTHAFWQVDEVVTGIEVRCFARHRSSATFGYAWTTSNVRLNPRTHVIMNPVVGIRFAHGSLDTLIKGMVATYPGLGKKLASIQAASTI
jgi:hypothetical protein